MEKKDYIKNCKDFILESITNNVSKYAIFSLFFLFGGIVIDNSMKILNEKTKDKKEKLYKLFNEYQEKIYRNFQRNILINKIDNINFK